MVSKHQDSATLPEARVEVTHRADEAEPQRHPGEQRVVETLVESTAIELAS
jgi:hypothetical protein